MKIVFLGTPEFAVPCLRELYNAGHEIAAVFSQPDRPSGRGYKLKAPPVKEFAVANGLNIHQPEKIKSEEAISIIQDINPEVIVVVAYGQILSKKLLDIPQHGCINVHASLLPKYRGAAPINWALIRGEKVTGVTTMFMDVGLDTGDMLLKAELPIEECDNAGTLFSKLSELGSNLIIETLEGIKKGTLSRIPQDNTISTYAPLLSRDQSRIDWDKSSKEINDLIRGMNPWPTAWTTLNDKKIKIFEAKILEKSLLSGEENSVENNDSKFVIESGISIEPGTILKSYKDSLVIACREGQLEILELQAENEKKMKVSEYLKGHRIESGNILK